MNLHDALQEFLLQLEADGRSPHTVGQYRRHVTALIDWLRDESVAPELSGLTPVRLAAFFASDVARKTPAGKEKTPTSLNAMRTSIRCFARYLHDRGLVPENPARLLRRARCAPPPPRHLRDDERQRLLDVLAAAHGPQAERDGCLILLLLETGVRIGAALAIDLEDIDLIHGEIRLRSAKNSRPRDLLLPRSTRERLQAFIGDRVEGPLFRAGAKRLSVRQAQRLVGQWFDRAGITGRSAHSLRHSFGTALLESSGDLRLVQTAMHHASVISTTVYATVGSARLRAALGA